MARLPSLVSTAYRAAPHVRRTVFAGGSVSPSPSAASASTSTIPATPCRYLEKAIRGPFLHLLETTGGKQETTRSIRQPWITQQQNLPLSLPSSNLSKCHYSTSRPWREGDKHNAKAVPPSSSSSESTALDSITTEANKWWNQGLDLSNQLFTSSTSLLEKGANQAAETASSLASKTLDETEKLTVSALSETQKLAQLAADETTKLASNSLQLVTKNLQHTAQQASQQAQQAATEAFHQAASGAAHLGRATTDTISHTTRAVGQAAQESVSQVVEQRVHKPIRETSRTIQETSHQLVETVTSSGRKLLKWVFWWSLAAVAVYGLVTTLPMALIKYTLERRNDNDKSNGDEQQAKDGAKSNTTIDGKDPSQDSNSIRRGSGIWRSIRNTFSSTASATAERDDK